MFRGDAAHGGDRPAAPTPAWRIAWRAELGARIDASPLVLAGGVLIATRTGVVVLLDAATGAERARAALGGGDVWATPAAAGDVIVVGVRRRQGGELVGLGARDLAVRWRRAVAEGGFGAATAVDGVVWLCNGAALVALAPATGREQARIALGDRCYGAPAAGGAAIVVATRDGQVRGFVGGRTVDRGATSAGADNDTAPVIAGERVLLGSNDHWLYALGARGEPRIPHIFPVSLSEGLVASPESKGQPVEARGPQPWKSALRLRALERVAYGTTTNSRFMSATRFCAQSRSLPG